MTSRPSLTWTNEIEFRIHDTVFVAVQGNQKRFKSTPDRFCVVKTPELVNRYAALVDELAPRRVVELGILQGGSTALLGALAKPTRLVAVDRSNDRVAALDAFLDEHELRESVHAYYGVDQGDTEQLGMILEAEFGAEPLDLVIDDASHQLDLTRASFNLLYPRLRPGGMYVIEDWSWAHVGYESTRPHDVPLTTLVFELVVALPSRPGIIDDITINREWAMIRRGPVPLESGEFDVSSCYSERGRQLIGSSPTTSGGRLQGTAASVEALTPDNAG
jgi:predicted O-methyltransferase YrrM